MLEIDAIVKKVLEGDKHAFRYIVERYSDMVFSISYRIIKDRELAREAAQDIFVKVYKSLSTFNGRSKLSTWIYKIAYNTSLNHIRRTDHKSNLYEYDDHSINQMSTDSDPEKLLLSNVAKEEVNNALFSLNEEERIIVTLFYYEDLSISEISEIVSLKANNVKIKLFRSRNKLYELLKHKFEMEELNYG